MVNNIAILALNNVDSDDKILEYMKKHEGEDGYNVYQFQNDTIEDMVNEIGNNCQDVLLVYDAQEGVTRNFDGFANELSRHEINPLVVVYDHDGYSISRDEAEMLVPDRLDDREAFYSYIPRVVFFDEDKEGFCLEPEFDEEININFLLN